MKLDDDFIADVGGASDIAGLRNVNIMRNARVVGNDIDKARAALERADDLRAMTFEHAQDSAGGP